MRLKKRQIKQIIREEKLRLIMEQMEDIDLDSDGAAGEGTDHHWPRVDWSNAVGELCDKWIDLEMKAFDTGDPSMTKDGELSNAEAKAYWGDQVESAGLDLENELTVEIRKVALEAMKRITSQLINGEYE